MSHATIVPAKNISRSKQSVKRSIEGQMVEVAMSTGVTVTAAFEVIASDVRSVAAPRRPNRCRPIHQDFNGFPSASEHAAWDAASDESWDSLDD